jgi:hypothetical protein
MMDDHELKHQTSMPLLIQIVSGVTGGLVAPVGGKGST